MTHDCEISKEDTVVLIRSLLSSTNSPCSVYTLNKDFKAETGFDIPLFGYSTLSDFLRSIPDTVKTTGIHPIEKVQLVSHEKSAHIVSLVQRQKQGSKKCGRKPHQINTSFYYPKTNSYNNKWEPDRWSKRNEFSSFRQNTKYVTNSDMISYEKNNSVEHEEQKDQENVEKEVEEEKEDEEEEEEEEEEMEFVNFSYLPKSLPSFKEVLRFEDKISPMDLSLYARVGAYVEVTPSKIYDPHKFYLHFRKNKKKLGRLMNELQLFYEEDTESFLMPAEAVKSQRTCAALYENTSKGSEWHRAEITNVINDFEVTVILIDYGIVAKIPRKNLRYLHRRFSSLPKQSFLGSLANIKPPNEEWSRSAIKKFSDLVLGKDLIAGVVEMNPKLNIPWMGVALSFTKETEIHVNDILVKEGFAKFEPGVGCDWQVSLSTRSSLPGSRYSSSTTGESSQERFPHKANSSSQNSSGLGEKIFYVPKNDRLKQMFYLKS